jgi:DNA-binding MarR family transcriptional regulator
MGDLAGRVLMSASGLTRIVERLVKKGLVVRDEDPSDRRAVVAMLTDDGLRLIRAASSTTSAASASISRVRSLTRT